MFRAAICQSLLFKIFFERIHLSLTTLKLPNIWYGIPHIKHYSYLSCLRIPVDKEESFEWKDKEITMARALVKLFAE